MVLALHTYTIYILNPIVCIHMQAYVYLYLEIQDSEKRNIICDFI